MMKNCILGAAMLLLASVFYACEDSTSANNAEQSYASRVDTLYVNSKDTVVVKEVKYVYDTLVRLDTLVKIDTVRRLDTLHKMDSVVIVKDSLVIKDTLVVYDTLVQKDTLVKLDTLVIKDTLVTKDTVYSKDTVVQIDTLYLDSSVYQGPAHDAVGYFVRIRDVMAGLRDNEKVVFFIRHSERTSDTGINGELTDKGKSQARELGQGLKAYGDFAFISSNYKRAAETCRYIAEGKEQGNYPLQQYADLTDSWYVINSTLLDQYKAENNNQGGWNVFSRWAYTSRYSDAFKDIDESSQKLMDKYLVTGYETMPKYTIAVSHDQMLVPFIAWATNRLVDLRYYDTKKWLNYMSGVALVVGESGHIRYIPVYPGVTDLYSGTM